MNFIVEILPKKENGEKFVYVVRAQNGFPLAVCDSIGAATKVIQEKHDQFLVSPRKNRDL